MHPLLTEMTGAEHVEIRSATPADRQAVERLALLDSTAPLAGEALVAEVDGELRAALSLSSRRPVSDPFRPNAHVVALLELRARQIDQARPARPRLARLLPLWRHA